MRVRGQHVCVRRRRVCERAKGQESERARPRARESERERASERACKCLLPATYSQTSLPVTYSQTSLPVTYSQTSLAVNYSQTLHTYELQFNASLGRRLCVCVTKRKKRCCVLKRRSPCESGCLSVCVCMCVRVYVRDHYLV